MIFNWRNSVGTDLKSYLRRCLSPCRGIAITPHEPFLEGVTALIIVAAALAGPLRGSGRPMRVLSMDLDIRLGVNPVVIYERWACLF
jgi:hypothetical protein